MAQSDAGIVRTEEGSVRGRQVGSTWVFEGIPYASPPVGPLRWRPPRRYAWTGVRPAIGFGYVSMQAANIRDPSSHAVGSEDCLTLNVFTPSINRTSSLPVLF